MSKEKGQQVVEHCSFPLEFQLPDGKDILQTAQRKKKKIQSFLTYGVQYACCLCRHLFLD